MSLKVGLLAAAMLALASLAFTKDLPSGRPRRESGAATEPAESAAA